MLKAWYALLVRSLFLICSFSDSWAATALSAGSIVSAMCSARWVGG